MIGTVKAARKLYTDMAAEIPTHRYPFADQGEHDGSTDEPRPHVFTFLIH